METRADIRQYNSLPDYKKVFTDYQVRKSRELCRDDLAACIGAEDAVRFTFVPQCLFAMACDCAMKAYQRAKEVKTWDCKKEMMSLRKYVEDYINLLGCRLGSQEAADAYNAYIQMFDAATLTDQFLTELKGREDAKNRSKKDPALCAYVTMAAELLREAYEYDRQASDRASKAMGCHISTMSLKPIEDLKKTLRSVSEKGYCTAPSKQLLDGIKAMRNKAYFLVPKVIEREKQIILEEKKNRLKNLIIP